MPPHRSSSEDEQPTPSKFSRRKVVADSSSDEAATAPQIVHKHRQQRRSRRAGVPDGEGRIKWTQEQKEFMLVRVAEWLNADKESKRDVKKKAIEEVLKKWDFPSRTADGMREVCLIPSS